MTTREGIVYRRDGMYLRHSESRTHTGVHHSYSWTPELDSATIFFDEWGRREALRKCPFADTMEPLKVTETRKVTRNW